MCHGSRSGVTREIKSIVDLALVTMCMGWDMDQKIETKAKTRVGEDPIDVHIGSRVRLRRKLLGKSQEAVADAVGVTYQQIQKYEGGTNRMGASRLFELSNVLQVPISFFFEEMSEEAGGPPPEPKLHSCDDNQEEHRETLEMVRAYYQITDLRKRKRIFELIKAIGQFQTPK